MEESSECREAKTNEVRKRNGCSNGRATGKRGSNQNSKQLRAGQWDKKAWEENFGDGEKQSQGYISSQTEGNVSQLLEVAILLLLLWLALSGQVTWAGSGDYPLKIKSLQFRNQMKNYLLFWFGFTGLISAVFGDSKQSTMPSDRHWEPLKDRQE